MPLRADLLQRWATECNSASPFLMEGRATASGFGYSYSNPLGCLD
jgi:hypothetical protein